jgi:hypothetical protein
MEQNNILIVTSLTLSVIFNFLSWIILIDMDAMKEYSFKKSMTLFGKELKNVFKCNSNTQDITAGQRMLAILTWFIGLVSLCTWAAALGLDNRIGLTDNNKSTQTLYSLATIAVIFDFFWMVITFKYWIKMCF